jgi:long-chain acyl-CoA synthetase
VSAPGTLTRLLFDAIAAHGHKPAALRHKAGGSWHDITHAELLKRVTHFALGLKRLGVRRADRVAILSENRPEWAISYLASACTGLISVPIDKDLKETEVYHILYLSGADAAIGDARHIDMLRDIQHKLPNLKVLIRLEDTGACDDAGELSFEHVKTLGRVRIAEGVNDFLERGVAPDDLISILFTSGTMGNSKGVMLSHGNIASNVCDAARWVNLGYEDRFLSVLPMHHCYECTHGFLLPLHVGAVTSYAESLRRIVENIAETRTTGVLGVPLLWHLLYKKIEAAMAEKGKWKVKAAKRVAALCQGAFGLDIRSRIFSGVHRKFGGSLRILISGGAAIDPSVARGFRELGIAFLQGYGLTESSPILAVNRDRAFKDEAAGLPLPSVEIQIAPDGEILARGPNIMKGYYNNPEATQEALQDGWLHTGDLGFIDDDGFLYVKGRKKSVIVTPGGKKVYPEEVEAEILKSPFIYECLVWAVESTDPARDVEVQAIVVPNTDYFVSQAIEPQGGMDEGTVESILRREVKARCLNLASFKRVTRLTVRYEEFEKTTTQKIKRYLYTGKPAEIR